MKELKIEKIWFAVLCLIVFAYASLFTSITYLSLGRVALFLAVIAALSAFVERKMEFDIALLFLFQAMFIMSLKDDMAQNIYDVCYGWLLVAAYLIGKMLVGTSRATADKRFIIGYYALGFGLIITGLVDIVYNYKIGFFDTEWIESIWTGDTVARTVYDLYGLFIVASLAFLFIKFKERKMLSLIGILLGIIYTFIMVRYEGRYCIFICILLIPLVFCIYIYDNWSKLSERNKKIIRNIVSACLVMLLAFAFMFKLNILGIKDIYENSYISGSGGIIHNVRFELAARAIKNMPSNINGGYSSGWRFGSHNTWLEFGNSFGVIVYVLLSCFRVIVICDAIKILLKRNVVGKIKYLLIPSFAFVNIYFSMEPIGFRRRHYFVLPLILFGMVRRTRELYDETDKDYKSVKIRVWRNI